MSETPPAPGVPAGGAPPTPAGVGALVAEVARRMVEVPEQQVDRAIDAVLQQVGEALDADVVSLVRHAPAGPADTMEVTHRWFAPRTGPLPWPREYDWTSSYPWLYPHLMQVGTFFAPTPEALPDAATREREASRQAGVTAAMWAPHVVDGGLEGMLCAFWRHPPPPLTREALLPAAVLCDIMLAALRRRDLDRARRVSESRYATLWASEAAGLCDWRWDGTIVRANDTLCRILGVTQRSIEARRINMIDATAPEYRDRHELVRRELEAHGTFRAFEKEVIRGDGSRAWVAIGGGAYAPEIAAEVGADGYLFVLDIGERKRLEAQLQQAQKMEAIGQLAGGIAHDFNNLLTVITTSAELAAEALPPELGPSDDLLEIVRTADRAAALTRQLLAFGRRQHRDLRVLDLNDVLREMQRLLRRVIGEDILLVTDLDPSLGTVRADEGQLQQVLLNLAVNARDAMPDGGTLTLRTGMLEVVGDEPEHLGLLGPGRYVRVSVADTGLGMDPATQARAFEPFFSTKPAGSGTGLGLAVVYGIVRQGGGNVWIARSDDSGTRIDFCLPAVDSPADARPVREGTVPPAEGQLVLLVEDDDAVRRLTHRLLTQLGYRVVVARDGGEAMARWQAHKDEVALLLSDIVMPGMSGHELSELLRLDRPDLPVVLMSGYSAERAGTSRPAAARVLRLEKPFTARELSERLADVLAPR